MLYCKYWDCGFCYHPNIKRTGCIGFIVCPDYKLSGEKMKRYRLKIPEMIRRKDIKVANALFYITDHFDGEIVPEKWAYGALRVKNIPKDWLEEIKDEPMSAEEYYKSDAVAVIHDSEYIKKRPQEIKDAFKAGAAEERKRYNELIEEVLGNASFEELEVIARKLKATNTEA